jgi:hypothetical protein
MSSERDSDEIVMVPVPRSQLAAVYRALAAIPGQVTATGTDESVDVHGQGPWTSLMVHRLEAELETPAIRQLLTLVAARAPKSLTFEEAVESTGVETRLLRAQVGTLTKTTRRLFGNRTWPMSVRYGEAGEAFYSMDPKVASWWLEATKGSQSAVDQ